MDMVVSAVIFLFEALTAGFGSLLISVAQSCPF